MSGESDFELRDFLYLDIGKVRSFAAVLQGGLATEVSDRLKQLGDLSGGIKLGALQVGANLDVSKSKEHERQQTLQITDPVLFDGLYRALKQDKGKNKIKVLDKAGLTTREMLAVNQFVQIGGIISPPVLESWIDQLRMMLNLLKKYNDTVVASTRQQQVVGRSRSRTQPPTNTGAAALKQFEAITELLSDYIQFSRKDSGKEYVRLTPKGNEYHVWCGLLEEYIVVPRADYQSEVIIVGQVERVLNETEEWKLVDLSRFGDQQTAASLISAVNSLPMGLNPIDEGDLIARYPDIFIRPIAIFR